MSRPQGPKPPQAPPLQPQQQHWSPQGEFDHSARALAAAAAQGWQASPQQPQQHAMPPQFHPQYAAPSQQPPPYGYPAQPPPAPAQYQHQQPQQQAAPRPVTQAPPSLPPQHDPHGYQRAAQPHQGHQQASYQPPQMRDTGGLDAFGVQVGQPAPPRTAPPSRIPPQSYQPGPQMPSGMRADPGNYDLGGYAVPPSRIPPPPQDHQQWAREPAPPSFAPAGLQQPGHYPGAPGRADGFGQMQTGLPQANLPVDQHQDHDDLEYEEEPRRSRRWMIAAALVLSIGVGGGMAYAYKTLIAPTKGTQTALVKATRDPAKVVPDNPGGKRFPNTDNKFMNRLDGEVAADGEAGGVKRVQTVTVGPDRGIVGAAPGAASAPRPVPGMTIVGAEALTQQAAGPPPGMGAAPGLPPARPVAQPAPVAGGPATARPAPAPPAAAPAPQPRPQVLAKAAPQGAGVIDGEPGGAAKQPVARAAPPAPKRTGGYVAVLGYQRSQLEAMKLMADLQQKYDVLRDKRLEVVESDQSARGLGTIYRVVVGPSGGLADAKNVCTQVVQAGHPAKDCYTLGN